jgi:GMP synthase (glutamine-hydrolysing)
MLNDPAGIANLSHARVSGTHREFLVFAAKSHLSNFRSSVFGTFGVMSKPRLLVIEGNTAEGRARQVAAGGEVASQRYARLLGELWPEAVVDICFPADPGANLPDGAGLESYDGVAITGSSLHIYDGGPAIEPQIEFVRAVYRAKTPIFGSCWGLQLATVAAGGTVHKNPRGREIGFGRRIRVTEAGAKHPLFHAKPPVFEALTVHLDEVESLPLKGKVLAMNDHSGVQAAEIEYEGGVAWGVQYHPEYNFREISAILKRLNGALVTEGFFASDHDASLYIRDIDALAEEPANRRLGWRHGLDAAVTNRELRIQELKNWIEFKVKPARSERGRA